MSTFLSQVHPEEFPILDGIDDEPDMTDLEADANALTGIGWGDDEDYGLNDCLEDW